MPTRFAVRALAAIGLIAASASTALAVPHTWDKTFTVGARPSIRVHGDDARIRIHSGPRGSVQAHVRYEAKHWGFTSPPREPQVTLEQTGSEVSITVREPSVIAVFGAVSEECSVDVTVPDSCDLAVRSGDGAVVVESPIAGALDVTTGDGRITLRGVRGLLRLSTGDGSIEGTDVDGSVSAHSSDGRVHLDGRFDVLDVRAADGHVEVTARRGSRLAADWQLETQDAGLELAIPKDLKADLDARTGDGRLHFDLPVTVGGGLDRHTIRGRLNGGGPVLRMRTGDGSLTLAASE